MTDVSKHKVELTFNVTEWMLALGLLFYIFLATAFADTPVSIQKCWNLGGVPIYRWYSQRALADCRFPSK